MMPEGSGETRTSQRMATKKRGKNMNFGKYYFDIKDVILVRAEEDGSHIVVLGDNVDCHLTGEADMKFMEMYLNQEKT